MPETDLNPPPIKAGDGIALLAERWPACFHVFERRRRPLKLGIHLEILAALDGAMTPAELTSALRRYTGNHCYLRRMSTGAARIGLDGNPTGTVSTEEAAAAAARLASYKRRRWAPSVSAPTPIPAPPSPLPAPKRIGLADLRREAQLRKVREAAAAPAGVAWTKEAQDDNTL
jgi:ProQ/FINO family